MAIAIFQNQKVGEHLNVEKISKQSIIRSLPSSHNTSADLLLYNKPPTRPSPPKFEGAVVALQNLLKQLQDFHTTGLAWALLRNISRGIFTNYELLSVVLTQAIPIWVPFNTHFAEKKSDYTKVQYVPAINAKPSDLSTVYTTLKKGQQLVKACGQKNNIHTFDQQLYAVAQHLKFDLKEELKDTVLRMGTFHDSCVLISCTGILWGDCGLRDMLVESGVYASKSIDRMLDGKEFHRVMRALTLCFEALLYLMYENFFEWLAKKDEQLFNKLRESFLNFRLNYNEETCSEETLNELIKNSENVLVDLFNSFREIRSSQSPTFKFWDECLLCIQLLLQLSRAEREGNWMLSKSSQAATLPYFFVCNKQNYSRWSTFHVLEMTLNLPEEVENEFLKGNFPVRLSPGPFRGIYSDMAVETTVIKDTKSATGIIGLTMKDSTVLRWSITRNILGLYSSSMLIRSSCSHSEDSEFVHEGERESEILKDEKHFNMILQYIKNHMSDPFSSSLRSDVLINISSGLVAPPETHDFLTNFKSIGIQKVTEFVSKRLETTENVEEMHEKTVGFFDPISKTNLKTFSETKKKTTLKINGKIITKVIPPEIVFQRALAVSTNRKDVNLKQIMSFPLTAIPSSLFKPDGCRRSTEKSDLLHVLEKEVQEKISIQSPLSQKEGIIIIDGMAELQALSSRSFLDFNSLGEIVLKKVMNRLHKASEVHLVFDRYDDESPNPKEQVRNRRYGKNNKTYDITGTRPLKDLKTVLTNNQNKSNLTKFICTYIKTNLYNHSVDFRNTNKKVYLAGGLVPRDNSFIINMNGICCIDPTLKCNHIDADTRLVFHVKCCQSQTETNQIIIVESPDTDVFILLLSKFQQFENKPELWFYTGKISIRTDLRRYIPIHFLSENLGQPLASSLISVHAITGCDTTSSLHFVGKKKTYAALKKISDEDLNDLSNLCSVSTEKAIEDVSKFMPVLYDSKNKE